VSAVGGSSLFDEAARGAPVPAPSVLGGGSCVRSLGAGPSLTHRPENRQQMDLIKLMGSALAYTGMTWGSIVQNRMLLLRIELRG
jgi:hypothetical protein